MTSSFAQPQSVRPTTAAAVVVGVVAGLSVVVLLVAGLTFFGLAIAFPIAVPVAEAYHVPISAADAALAERFAGFWWAFLGLAIASIVAAAVVVVKVANFLSPVPRD